MSDNVIPFPRPQNNQTINISPTIEEILQHNENLKLTHVNQTLEFLNELLLDQLTIGGFQLDYQDNRLVKDVTLISEAIRALLYKYYGLEHPLHKVSETLYEINSPSEQKKDDTEIETKDNVDP